MPNITTGDFPYLYITNTSYSKYSCTYKIIESEMNEIKSAFGVSIDEIFNTKMYSNSL